MLGNVNPSAWSDIDPAADIAISNGTNYLGSDYSSEALYTDIISKGISGSFSRGEVWFIDFTVAFSSRQTQNYTIEIEANDGSATYRMISWRDSGSGGHTYEGNMLLSWDMLSEADDADDFQIKVSHRTYGEVDGATNVLFSVQGVRLREASSMKPSRYSDADEVESFDDGNIGM